MFPHTASTSDKSCTGRIASDLLPPSFTPFRTTSDPTPRDNMGDPPSRHVAPPERRIAALSPVREVGAFLQLRGQTTSDQDDRGD